jgi:hypothetical protein
LSEIRDLLAQHADSLLRLHFSIYQKTVIIDKRPGGKVGVSKISKNADKFVVTKL